MRFSHTSSSLLTKIVAISKAIHDERYIQLITRLRRARKKAGLKQSDVAEQLGLDQTSISKIETCERRIDILELIDYCRAVGTRVSEIVDNNLLDHV
jgi:transcriptional regulator with XRE-family HTH domain